jgi:YVTN family beta-propeller protein
MPIESIPAGDNPFGIAFDDSNGYVYVTNYWSDNVTVINGATDQIVGSVGTGPLTNPNGIAYDSSNGCIYVTNMNSANVTVINGTSIVKWITVGVNPQGVAFDSANGYLFVANVGSDSITVIDGATNSALTSVGIGSQPSAVAFDSLNGYIYVTSNSSKNVTVINGTTDMIAGSIPVGLSFGAIGFDGQNGYLYASNDSSSNVTVINGASNRAVGTITVGMDPLGIMFDSSNGDIYVADEGSNMVSVVSPFPISMPAITSFAAVPRVIDVGDSTNLTADVSGGVPPYSYSYTNLPSGCTSANLSTLQCIPSSAGTFLIQVFVNDSGGWPMSATVSLTVDPLPSVALFTATSSVIDLGSSTTLLVLASGGTAPYEYAYTGLPAGCVSYDSATILCSPTAAGIYDVRAFVNDSIRESANKTLSLTVNLAIYGLTFTTTSSSVDIGGSTTFVVSVSGGTSPFNYRYTGLPSGCGTSNSASLPCSPNAAGSSTVRVFVNDSAGDSVSLAVALTVNPTISFHSFVDSPDTIDLGNSTALSVFASGGTAPLTYAYTGLPAGCASYSSPTLLCTPVVTGTFLLRVFINDSMNDSVTATAYLEVNPALSDLLFTASRNPIDKGGTTVLTALVTGGTGPFSYMYTGLPTGCTTADQFSLSCTPDTVGDFAVRVFINDSAGQSMASTLALTVNYVPSIVSFGASSSSLDTGDTVALAVVAAGGTTPYTIAYSGLPGGCVSYNSPTISCSPTDTGIFHVRVFVNDSANGSINATEELVVNSPVSISSFSALPDAIDLGDSTELAVSIYGGTAPFAFSYSGLPAGCSSLDVLSFSCKPTSFGAYHVHVTANDSAGMSAVATVFIAVNPEPTISSFSVSTGHAYTGQAVYFVVSTSGGTSPYTYVYKGLPKGCISYSTASLPCASLVSGSFNVRVYFNDTENESATSTTTLTINAPITLKTVALDPALAWLAVGKGEEFTTALSCAGTCPSGAIYSWNITRPSMGTLNSTTYSVETFTASNIIGSVGLFVNVSLDGFHVQSNVAIVTISETVPVLTSLDLTPSSPTVSRGADVVFEVLVTCSNGACPSDVSYTWSVDSTLGKTVSSYGPYTTFVAGNTSGSTTLTVTASLDGSSLNGSTTITIVSSSSGGISLLGLPGDWGYVVLGGTIAVLVIILIVILTFRREEDSELSTVEGEPILTPEIEGSIASEAPTDYYSGLVAPPPSTREVNESEAYGTFEAAPESAAIAEKPGLGKDRYTPFSITITPAGIMVEGVKKAEPQVTEETIGTEERAPRKVSERDVYSILVLLAERPRSFKGIGQEVLVNDPDLSAILNALTKSKLVTRGETNTQGVVYALTPLGRKLGHKFLGQTKQDEQEAEETPPAVKEGAVEKPASKEGPKSQIGAQSDEGREGTGSTAVDSTPRKDESQNEDKKTLEGTTPDENIGSKTEPSPGNEKPVKEAGTSPSKGGIILERTLGQEHNEENPFEGDIKPEEVNPNVKHLDPKLLQPMELRITQGSSSESDDATHPADTSDKTKELMERAKRSKEKPRSRFGFMRAKKPEEDEEDKG